MLKNFNKCLKTDTHSMSLESRAELEINSNDSAKSAETGSPSKTQRPKNNTIFCIGYKPKVNDLVLNFSIELLSDKRVWGLDIEEYHSILLNVT